MKLVKTLLATTLAITAFSTFAATPKDQDSSSENVISSSKEQPVNAETSAAGQPTTAQPGADVAAEETTAPATSQPAQ